MNQYIFRRNIDGRHITDGHVDTLLGYLRQFDPIKMKYCVDWTAEFPPEARAYVCSYENIYQFGAISKQEYSYIQENLKLVYGSSKIVDDDTRTYYLTEEKIIHRYLAIPQLDKMFDEDYFNFEWDMHVGQNYNEHRNNYYRDHFIHQVRDMYMMLVMLDKFNFYEASIAVLQQGNSGKISDYVSKRFLEFRFCGNSEQIDILKRVYSSIRTDSVSNHDDGPEKYISDYYYRYVIYASSILSALFHDMGYPICHFLEVRQRLSNYNPTLYMFTNNTIDSFDQLVSLLSPSLLFTIVSHQRIKRSLQISKDGKFNHGAYSAIAFLLQFYNNGSIYSLSPEKQCAVELAALAIYNHTVKFNIEKYNSNNAYYAPFFRQNPISFLLRFCDDLQEWDRRYFEISESSDLMFCQKCGVPLLKATSERESRYECFCGDGEEVLRPDIFIKRKLYLVTVADTVSASYISSQETLNFFINYDLYKLLMLSNINRTYAKYRLKELRGLKKFIQYQDFNFMSDNKLPFHYIKIDYFMTANPILIKLKILEEFLRSFDVLPNDNPPKIVKRPSPHNDSELTAMIENYILSQSYEKLVSGVFAGKLESASPLFRRMVTNSAMLFYLSLLQRCLIDAPSPAQDYKYKDFISAHQEDQLYSEAMKVLIYDCIKQYEKELSVRKDEDYAPLGKFYYDSYVSDSYEDKLYHSIGVYTDAKNDFNRYKSSSLSTDFPYIGYYMDILLFEKMNEYLVQE